MTGLFVPPGQGDDTSAAALQITFKVTGDRSRHTTVYETVVAPGFDVGAHLHHNLEECFYILDGEIEVFAFDPVEADGQHWSGWESADGRRPVRAGAGSCVFVPPGCPHAFRNNADTPARLFQTASPAPFHELYLKAMSEALATNPNISPEELARLREAHDIHQLTPLKYPG
ncbi:cupin domain-containing protein [Actinomadura fulvescens]|uniref:Cupin domain-containing protein n=1 Tax=Actinomadura fulvescens TaxID=46160 RepID=A0ABN3QYU4_9ACTN